MKKVGLSMGEKRNWQEAIAGACIKCGECKDSCRLLTKLNETPGDIVARGVTADDAYGCALCGKCEAVCKQGLSPYHMFEERRVEAVANGEIDVDEYFYIFPDRPVTVMSLFRDYYGIDYSDLNSCRPSGIAFLPGCSLMTYSPGLTRKIYETLARHFPDPVFLDNCCGLTMYHIGLPKRGDQIKARLREKLGALGVRELIVACPNCYYQLKKEPAYRDVKLVTVYEALEQYFVPNTGEEIYAVHDSCPDRFEGIFARQVRAQLDRLGYRRVEMKHHGRNAVCCGSSGQLGHFHPNWAMEHEVQNLEEAKAAGATTLVADCHACVLNFGDRAGDTVKVQNALNVLLGFYEDYRDVKRKAAAMFEGEEGEELYLKLYED